jgi:hypothetical protein
MVTHRPFIIGALIVMVSAYGVRPASAQAWVLPAHTGSITFVTQKIDHVGRLKNDGTRNSDGQFVDLGFDAELDYAFTDRWSISTSLPFIAAKYTDQNPPPSGLPFGANDSCRCWQSGFSDVGVTSRYNLVNRGQAFMLTPFVAVGVPSHAYDTAGEAVLGRRLKELRVGAAVGQRLDSIVSGLSAGASYQYAAVGRVLGVPVNRSNGSVQVGYALRQGLAARGLLTWQRTHGGLRGWEVVDPEFPERLTQFDRMLRDNYLQTGGGVSYSRGAWDISGSFLRTARGSNSHDVHVFSLTASRLFEIHGR